MTRSTIALVCCSFFAPIPTIRADWPGWRGPTGQGFCAESNLPMTWSKDGTNVLWKVRLPGHEGKNRQDQNQSSPIIVKNSVVITTSFWPEGVEPGKNQPEHRVAGFNFDTGKLLWETPIKPGPWKLTDLRGGYSAPTPASDGERIFAVFGSSVLAALDLDGKPLWRVELTPFDFDVAFGSSPVLFGDKVILQCDGVRKSSRLVAFDRKTGDVRWEKKRPGNDFSHSTPTLATVGGKRQLLVAASNALQGIDPDDGSVLWSCAGRGDTASPVHGEGVVYLDSGRGGQGIAVDPNGVGDVTKSHLKWQFKMAEGLSSPVIVVGHLFRLHSPGVLACRNLKDGSVVYSERLTDVSTAASPIATADGMLYLASAGKSYLVKASPKFEVAATNDLGDASNASAAVSAGRIVLKGRQYLYCIGK